MAGRQKTQLEVVFIVSESLFSPKNCQIRILRKSLLIFKIVVRPPKDGGHDGGCGGYIVNDGRYSVLFYSTVAFVISAIAAFEYVAALPVAVVLAMLTVLGWYEYTQKKHSVLGNYPLLGRFRFIFESIRPELRQYFWESDTDELPFSRNQRSMVYQRAKGMIAARPFGSILDMYSEEHNWINHSITPSHINDHDFYTTVGRAN